MPVAKPIAIRASEHVLGSLRDRWNDSAERFAHSLGFYLSLDSLTYNEMAGTSRKFEHEKYSKFLAVLAYHAGAVKERRGSFDDWLDAVEKLSEWRLWNLL
jgi:hypothetical protein